MRWSKAVMTSLAAMGLLLVGNSLACDRDSDSDVPEECEQAVEHVISFVVGPSDVVSEGEQAAIEQVRSISMQTCASEGLSDEQLECILDAETMDEFMALGECEALRESPPSWLQVPYPASE